MSFQLEDKEGCNDHLSRTGVNSISDLMERRFGTLARLQLAMGKTLESHSIEIK